MNLLSDIRLRVAAGVLVTLLSTAPATAYDLNAAAAAFDADKARLTAGSPVLSGWSGNDSAVDEYSIERIGDRRGWDALWARHAPGTSAPDVDFSTAMVVAIFAGATRTSVTPEIHLDGVAESEKIIVTTMSYENDVIREERRNLYLFIVLRRSGKAVQVYARSYGLMRSPQEVTILLKEFAANPALEIGR